MKYITLYAFLFFLTAFTQNISADDNEKKKDNDSDCHNKPAVYLASSGDIDLGDIIQGTERNIYDFENYILFEIRIEKEGKPGWGWGDDNHDHTGPPGLLKNISKKKRGNNWPIQLCISRVKNDGDPDGVELETTWKMGKTPNTENNYVDGIVELEKNEIFYVKCIIHSAKASSNASTGGYNFQQMINVEFVDF